MLTVSNYHYIRENYEAPYPSIFGVTPASFERQLLLLRDTGTFIHPRELLEDPDSILKAEENYILLTFDDGLKEQLIWGKPILDKLGIAALFFVNSINYTKKKVSLVHKIHLLRSQIAPSILLHTFTASDKSMTELTAQEKEKAEIHYNYDDIESAHLKYLLNFKLSASAQSELIDGLFIEFFDEGKVAAEIYMSEMQLKDLANEDMLGSHTHSHSALGMLAPEVIYQELDQTKKFLETLTQRKIESVSYPFGSAESCVDPVPQLARKAGYKIGFTTERGINSGREDHLLLQRFDCNDLPGGKNYQIK